MQQEAHSASTITSSKTNANSKVSTKEKLKNYIFEIRKEMWLRAYHIYGQGYSLIYCFSIQKIVTVKNECDEKFFKSRNL